MHSAGPTSYAPSLIAHRGFSARDPEMTRAAYESAIAWSEETGIPLGLECDVHFSADDQLICLHDLTLDRTATVTGRACDLTVEQLKRVDVGSRRIVDATPAQCEVITLDELLSLAWHARSRGVDISMVIETKHPNPRGTAVEDRLAELLSSYGWTGRDAPVRVISFAIEGVQRLGVVLPDLRRTFLLQHQLGRWTGGELPDGITTVGPDLRLIKQDPDFVRRSHACGHKVDVWTVNTPEDIRLCRDLGVDGITTDDPHAVATTLGWAAARPAFSEAGERAGAAHRTGSSPR